MERRQEEKVIRRLATIIGDRAGKGFAVAVIKKDYDELMPPELRKKIGEFHYTWAVRAVIGFMEKWRLENGVVEPTEYIFDRMVKGKERNEIDRVFEEAGRVDDSFHRYGIYKGCHSFRDKSQVLPLQAADIGMPGAFCTS